METASVLDIGQQAVWVLIKVTLPVMIISLAVGLVVSLFQALTQIQEMTLAFIPKIIAVFFAMLGFMGYVGYTLVDFGNEIFNRITILGG